LAINCLLPQVDCNLDIKHGYICCHLSVAPNNEVMLQSPRQAANEMILQSLRQTLHDETPQFLT